MNVEELVTTINKLIHDGNHTTTDSQMILHYMITNFNYEIMNGKKLDKEYIYSVYKSGVEYANQLGALTWNLKGYK